MSSRANGAGRAGRHLVLAALMLLGLALHWAADMAWLCQSASTPAAAPSAVCTSAPAGSTAAAPDPHDEGAIPRLPQPLAAVTWIWLAALPYLLLLPAARAALLQPPALVATS
jgi:hypothetical protein